ncbi:Dabb family protein [Paenibacillus psychroresistens]|uniref:Dabb family protein n=1 Tax=Paenibacillus psychroresistens TaxID=1778678 RepID=A0A6B8RQR7_9BACL|nr:Dabb family protein [Paenibacillus psychroresistens]QGQ98144.1 Dabb family protein [Paenibacillus psychroresistens]
MYEHLVSFKFNEKMNPQKAKELIEVLLDFKTQIPGIIELTAGINETAEVDNIHGYSLGLRVTFQDKAALLQYGPHPAHQQFVKLLDGLVENVVVIDYPIGK